MVGAAGVMRRVLQVLIVTVFYLVKAEGAIMSVGEMPVNHLHPIPPPHLRRVRLRRLRRYYHRLPLPFFPVRLPP